MTWGPRPSKLAAAMLRPSQVCWALRRFAPWSGASRHGCAALGRSAFGRGGEAASY